MIDVDELRRELRPTAILDALGVTYARAGRELRARLCPSCGPRSRDAVAINAESGQWIDHAHGCRGDVLALVAGLVGLDVARDYPAVLERAAELARVAPVEQPRPAAPAPPKVDHAAAWGSHARRSIAGERYLLGRGIDPAELVARDVVRFTVAGEPAVLLRDLGTGAITGIQRRRIDGSEPRVLAAAGSRIAGSVLAGRPDALEPNGVDVAIAVEGLADTLAAHLAWPGCAIYGVPGVGQYERVVAAVAPRVRACRGWLLLVADGDDAGVTGAARGVLAAERSGLELGRDLHLVDLGGAHDLADAWRAGWRYRWPATGGLT